MACIYYLFFINEFNFIHTISPLFIIIVIVKMVITYKLLLSSNTKYSNPIVNIIVNTASYMISFSEEIQIGQKLRKQLIFWNINQMTRDLGDNFETKRVLSNTIIVWNISRSSRIILPLQFLWYGINQIQTPAFHEIDERYFVKQMQQKTVNLHLEKKMKDFDTSRIFHPSVFHFRKKDWI